MSTTAVDLTTLIPRLIAVNTGAVKRNRALYTQLRLGIAQRASVVEGNRGELLNTVATAAGDRIEAVLHREGALQSAARESFLVPD